MLNKISSDNNCIQFAVTAAHCCDGIGIEDTRIVVGDHNVEVDEGQEQFMQIESLKIHENYDPNTIDYDVCVLTVSFKKVSWKVPNLFTFGLF